MAIGGDINKDGFPEIFVGEDGGLTQNGTNGTGTVSIYSYGKFNGIKDTKEPALQNDYKLYTNYPNPFNPTTTISYQLPVRNFVSLKVFNLLGKEIAILVNEEKNAGNYSTEFDANKYNLSSGIYFYELKTNEHVERMKMVLIK